VMHLMYARFFHKFMRDIELVSSDEPFARLLTQGMVTKDGAKMSKSKGNVVDPQYIIDRYGADTVRIFMLFASPPEKDVEWSDEAAKGAFRFLNRVWRLFEENLKLIRIATKMHKNIQKGNDSISTEIKELRYSTHHTIQKVLSDIEDRMQFNTAIAAIMEHLNNIYSINDPEKLNDIEKAVFAESCTVIPRLLYFFAPHISEELWKLLEHDELVHETGIPEYNPGYLIKDEITYVVQIMGKIRGKLEVPVDTSQEDIKKLALEIENVKKHLEGKEIKKIIVIPKKLVSIVTK